VTGFAGASAPSRSPYDRGVTGMIVSLVAAEPGWRAIYLSEDDEDRELTRVVAWALVEDEGGARAVVGMVIDSSDPTRIVAAPEGASETAPEFDRYGFKEG
jgi:hypothetical protein